MHKDSKSGRAENMLLRILNKVERSKFLFNEMKKDVLTLKQMVTSHSVSIKQLETQMGQSFSHLNLNNKGAS